MVKLEDLILLNNGWDFGTTLEIIIFAKSEESYSTESCKVCDALNKYRNSNVLAFSKDTIVIEF